jgi:hypothetical protein
MDATERPDLKAPQGSAQTEEKLMSEFDEQQLGSAASAAFAHSIADAVYEKCREAEREPVDAILLVLWGIAVVTASALPLNPQINEAIVRAFADALDKQLPEEQRTNAFQPISLTEKAH